MNTEARLQHDCFTWHWNAFPHERGRLWMQYNNPKNARHGAVLKGMGLVAGVSDMAYLKPDGRTAFVEFKEPAGRQSLAQKQWQQTVTALGAEYRIVTSLEQFQKIIQQWQTLSS